jgi:putative transposase
MANANTLAKPVDERLMQVVWRAGSMSAVGNLYHNAQAESFTKTLKPEDIYQASYDTLANVSERLPMFIERVCNAKRLPSDLSY